jgi:hypothetical protein
MCEYQAELYPGDGAIVLEAESLDALREMAKMEYPKRLLIWSNSKNQGGLIGTSSALNLLGE